MGPWSAVWWVRWRVAARIARREARRAKGRTALVAVLVALPVLAGTTALVGLASAVATDATFSRLTLGTEAQARVRHECPVSIAQDIRGANGGSCTYDGSAGAEESLAVLEQHVRDTLGPASTQREYVSAGARAVGGDQGIALDYAEVVVDEVTKPVLQLAAGSLPSARGEVVAMPWALHALDVQIGDPVTLTVADGTATAVLIVGELSGNAQVAAMVGLPGTAPALADARDRAADGVELEWFVGGPAPVTWAQVLDLNQAGFAVVSRAVLADPPPRSAMPYYRDGWSRDGGPSVSTGALYAGLIGVGLVETVLLVGPAFAVGAQRSRRALALQGAVGADRAQLRRTVLGGALVVGLGATRAGAAAGAALGAVLVRAVPHFANVVVPWTRIAGVVAIGILVSLAAAALPARTAGRLDVLAVLSGRAQASHPRSHTLPVGLALASVGAGAAFVGSTRDLPAVTFGGVAGVLLGTVTAAPGLLGAAAGAHLHLPLAGRYALRDAMRHRSRTGPVLAAVIAAVAGGVTGMTLLAGDLAHQRATYTPASADGVVRIVVDPSWLTRADLHRVPALAVAAAADAAPLGGVASVQVLAVDDAPGARIWVEPAIPPEKQCPFWLLERELTSAERVDAAADPRCTAAEARWGAGLTYDGQDVIVDDGTLVHATRLAGSAKAAEALARGAALVDDARELWPDGTVHLTVWVNDAEATHLTLPGHVLRASFTDAATVLPSAALPDLAVAGITSLQVGALVDPPRPLTDAEVASVSAAVAKVVGAAPFVVTRADLDMPPADTSTVVGVAIALVLALAATWIAVGLAAVDQQADLATLASVGADPRSRRRLAGAHAGVLAAAGTTLGIVVGLVIGNALTLGRRGTWPDLDPAWTVQVPWAPLAAIAVGLPTIAAAVAWAATRSRVTMVRRHAD